MSGEFPPAPGCEADPEPLGGRTIEAAGIEELPARDGIGGDELAREEVRRLPVGLEDPLPQAGFGTIPATAIGVAQLDPGAVCEVLHRLGEGEVVDLLDEVDDVPALAAAEALEEPAGGNHVETGGPFVVEGAQPAERIAAVPAQRHIGADDILDPRAFPDRRQILVVDQPCHEQESIRPGRPFETRPNGRPQGSAAGASSVAEVAKRVSKPPVTVPWAVGRGPSRAGSARRRRRTGRSSPRRRSPRPAPGRPGRGRRAAARDDRRSTPPAR